MCPKDVALNAHLGYQRGMGMSIVTFDWAQIAYIGFLLAIPWWAAANVTIGFWAFFRVLISALHLGGTIVPDIFAGCGRG